MTDWVLPAAISLLIIYIIVVSRRNRHLRLRNIAQPKQMAKNINAYLKRFGIKSQVIYDLIWDLAIPGTQFEPRTPVLMISCKPFNVPGTEIIFNDMSTSITVTYRGAKSILVTGGELTSAHAYFGKMFGVEVCDEQRFEKMAHVLADHLGSRAKKALSAASEAKKADFVDLWTF